MARSSSSGSTDGVRLPNITGVKVFSATKSWDRGQLGELITTWIRSHPDYEIVDKVITQSSDRAFHCLTITLFYRQSRPT